MPTLFESESLESKAVPFNMREFNDLSVSLRKPKDSGLTDQFKRKIQINEEDVDQLRLRKKQSTNVNSGEKEIFDSNSADESNTWSKGTSLTQVYKNKNFTPNVNPYKHAQTSSLLTPQIPFGAKRHLKFDDVS
jgi:hypothetical protein